MRERLIDLIQTSVDGCARHWAEVIADYLLENGVVVLPCKVGDVVYEIIDIGTANAQILDLKVLNIKIDGIMTIFFCKTVKKYLYNYGSFSLDNFGKTVFLTREEAERALKGDEGK